MIELEMASRMSGYQGMIGNSASVSSGSPAGPAVLDLPPSTGISPGPGVVSVPGGIVDKDNVGVSNIGIGATVPESLKTVGDPWPNVVPVPRTNDAGLFQMGGAWTAANIGTIAAIAIGAWLLLKKR